MTGASAGWSVAAALCASSRHQDTRDRTISPSRQSERIIDRSVTAAQGVGDARFGEIGFRAILQRLEANQ
jgi:hypothetical protein